MASCIVALLFLWGCASERTSTYAELGQEANTKGFGQMYPPDTAEGEFTFGVGDSVAILVQNNTDLSGTFVIRMDGKVTLNVVGDMLVAGLTAEQVKRKLEAKVAVYMKDPAITVAPVAIVSKKYYIAASNPLTGGYIVRAVPYRGDTTLFEVWALMGSPSSSLDNDTAIKVIRPDPRHPQVKVVNIREMLVCGYSGGNVQIKPNDIVLVPPTVWGMVAQVTAAIAAPFQGLFYVTGVYYQLDSFARVITGDDSGRFGGYSYYGGGGYGGGLGQPGGQTGGPGTVP
jgi:polysaccharide biosynthesis/export protein